MLANARTLDVLLHSPDQFVIPLFQRFYVWEPKDWDRLWSDIAEMLEPDAPREHFMGSLVCMQGDHQPGTVPQYLVIDGQQRLTTFIILLCALRDEARTLGADRITGNIQDNYLTQEYEEGLERYRVLPRLRDRQELFNLVDAPDAAGPQDHTPRINQAYTFFRKQLQAAVENRPDWLKKILTIITDQLTVVVITLQKDQNENPFAIFETLNSTGQRLEEADLIRNHVFMHVPLSKQDQFDETLWQPFEDSLHAADGFPQIRLTDFYRDFLMRDGQYVRPDEVYVAFREQMAAMTRHGVTPVELTHLLSRYARYYRWIYRPSTMPDLHVRTELAALARLRLGLSTAHPLVLHLLNLHGEGVIGSKELVRCLRAIESFAIRRSITGESTRPYHRFFPSAIKDLKNEAVLLSLVGVLAKRGWPDDTRFLASLESFPIYQRERDILRLMLLNIEQRAEHKEPVDVETLLDENKLQIEHVLPQTISDDHDGQSWKAMLGADWQAEHDALVHTLGNLTFTGYNPELSNSAFVTKREELRNSHLELNRQIAQQETWDCDAISTRGLGLAKTVAAIWPAASGFESV